MNLQAHKREMEQRMQEALEQHKQEKRRLEQRLAEVDGDRVVLEAELRAQIDEAMDLHAAEKKCFQKQLEQVHNAHAELEADLKRQIEAERAEKSKLKSEVAANEKKIEADLKKQIEVEKQETLKLKADMSRLQDAHDDQAKKHSEAQENLQKALDTHAAENKKLQKKLKEVHNAANRAELEANLHKQIATEHEEKNELKLDMAKLKDAHDVLADDHANAELELQLQRVVVSHTAEKSTMQTQLAEVHGGHEAHKREFELAAQAELLRTINEHTAQKRKFSTISGRMAEAAVPDGAIPHGWHEVPFISEAEENIFRVLIVGRTVQECLKRIGGAREAQKADPVVEELRLFSAWRDEIFLRGGQELDSSPARLELVHLDEMETLEGRRFAMTEAPENRGPFSVVHVLGVRAALKEPDTDALLVLAKARSLEDAGETARAQTLLEEFGDADWPARVTRAGQLAATQSGGAGVFHLVTFDWSVMKFLGISDFLEGLSDLPLNPSSRILLRDVLELGSEKKPNPWEESRVHFVLRTGPGGRSGRWQDFSLPADHWRQDLLLAGRKPLFVEQPQPAHLLYPVVHPANPAQDVAYAVLQPLKNQPFPVLRSGLPPSSAESEVVEEPTVQKVKLETQLGLVEVHAGHALTSARGA